MLGKEVNVCSRESESGAPKLQQRLKRAKTLGEKRGGKTTFMNHIIDKGTLSKYIFKSP